MTPDELEQTAPVNEPRHAAPTTPFQTIRPDDMLPAPGTAETQVLPTDDSTDEAETIFALRNLEERRKKKRRSNRLKIAGAVALALALVGWFGLRGMLSGDVADDSFAPSVIEVTRQDFKTTVQGNGSLQPASQSVVTPEVDGIIEDVRVVEGQQVNAGDVLFTLRNNDLDKLVSDASRQVDSAASSLGDAQNAMGRLQQAYDQDRATYDSAVAAAQEAQQQAAAAGQAAYDESMAGPEAEYQEAINDYDAAADALSQATFDVENLPNVIKAAEQARDEAQDLLDKTNANPNATQEEKDEAAQALIDAQTHLDEVSSPSYKQKLEFNLTTAQIDLSNAEVKKSNADTRYQLAKAEAEQARQAAEAQIPIPPVPDFSEAAYVSQIEAARSAVTSAESALTSAQAAYDQAVENAGKRVVRAPKGGTLIALGAVAGAGVGGAQGTARSASGSLATIADLTKMGVTVQVNEVDISTIKAGQVARVTFSALPDLELEAKVTSVASMSSGSGEGFGGGGVSTYAVELEIEHPDARLKPGMTASVTITTQDVPNALVVPVSAIIEEGDGSFVYVVTDQETYDTERRQVSLGERNSMEAVVTNGLTEGEVISLSGDLSASMGE